jgi:NitT/TauT family transport system permease protein
VNLSLFRTAAAYLPRPFGTPAGAGQAGDRRLFLARALALYGPPLASLLAALGAWEGAVRLLHIKSYLLPPPSSVFRVLWSSRSVLLADTVVTMQEVMIGFAIAAGVAIPLAWLIVSSPLLERSLYPLLVVSQTVPKIAVAPLFIIWFGFEMTSKIVTVILICFFPVLIDSIVGLRSVSPESLELFRSMGAGRWATFWHLRLPASLPYVLSGLKVAITLAVVGAVVGEFIGSTEGLGYRLLTANANLRTDMLFAAVTVLTVTGLALFYILDLCERTLFPWHISRRSVVREQGM